MSFAAHGVTVSAPLRRCSKFHSVPLETTTAAERWLGRVGWRVPGRCGSRGAGVSPVQAREEVRTFERMPKGRIADMGVYRGGCDILVAQKPLQEAKIYAVFEQQRCARVSEHMRRHSPFHSGVGCKLTECPADSLCRPSAPARSHQRALRRTPS